MVTFDDNRAIEQIDPAETAILVVDMINEFVAEGAAFDTPAARAMVPRLEEVLDESRAAGVDIIYLKQENRPDGSDAGTLATMTPGILTGEAHAPNEQTEIYPALAPADDDTVVIKHQYNGFFETELDSVLRNRGISTVVITGVASHICCDSTMRGAFFRGYDIVVLEDGNATFDVPDQGWGDVPAETIDQVWYSTVDSNFGDVLPSEAFLDEIRASASVQRS